MGNEVTNTTANGEIVNPQTGEVTRDNRRFVCTVDVSTFDGKKALVNARNSATNLTSVGDGELVITGAYMAPGTRAVSGSPCTNTYLFANDDVCYFTQSDGIARSVLDIVDVLPDFNAPEGIRVKVKTTKLQNDRTIKSLQIL